MMRALMCMGIGGGFVLAVLCLLIPGCFREGPNPAPSDSSGGESSSSG